MLQHIFPILLLLLPFLSHSADQRKKNTREWIPIFLMQEVYTESPFSGNMEICCGLKIIYHKVNDYTTLTDVRNALIRYAHQDVSTPFIETGPFCKVKQSEFKHLVVTRVRPNQMGLIARTKPIPNIYKQLRNRELTGKPIRDTRKRHD